MKKLLLLLTTLLVLSPSLIAQGGNTTVTAHILDPNGAVYTQSQVNITYIEPNTVGKIPLLNGSTFQKQYTIFATDSFGFFTISIPDNGLIDSGSGVSGDAWSFRVIYNNRSTSFVYVTPINCALNIPATCTAGTMDISAQIQAVAAILPATAGGGGALVVRNIPCASTINFQVAGTFPTSANTAFTVPLTCNVTSTSITQASGGTIQKGTIAQFTLTQDNIGGRTFAWPANFIDQPTIQATANATTNASFWYDGTNWHAQTFPASGGGGGGNPAGVSGDAQGNNGVGGFNALKINDNGSAISINEDLIVCGPNSYNDVRCYGGSSSTSTTTASCNGTTVITLTSALDFKDATKFPFTSIGNGIVIYQCGAATGLTVPAAPTVTPSGVTGGSTTYNYKIVPEDLSGGLTAASAQGQTTTGASALGNTTVNLTAATWASTLNGQNTYTCSGNCNIQDGTLVRIDGFTNTNFGGNYTIVSHPDSTHFVTSSPRTPTVTSESVAATAKLLACNVLTLPASSVASIETSGDTVLRYWVYRNNTLASVIQGHDPYYEDCGMNIASSPSYVPATPGSAVNKYLATTIVSGGGTTSLVVANAAGNTISGQTALHDSSQNLLAATNASHFSTPVYVPSLTFNATTVFTNAKAANTEIWLPNGASIGQPWVVKTNGILFRGGQSAGSDSFQFENLVHISGSGACCAWPVVYVQPLTLNSVGSGVQFKNIYFAAQQLGQTAFLVQFDINALFGLQMSNVGFSANNTSSNVNTPAASIAGITESTIGKVGERNQCTTTQNSGINPPCIRFTTISKATSTLASILGTVQVNGFSVLGGGPSFQVDALPYTNSNGGSVSGVNGIVGLRFLDGLREQGKGAYLRVASPVGGSFYMKGIDDDAPNAASGNGWVDNVAGSATSFFDEEQMSTSVTGQVFISGPGNFRAGPGGGYTAISSSSIGVDNAAGATANGNVSSNGATTVGYLMSVPAAPSVVVGGSGSCASNCVAAGTYFYAVSAIDIAGYEAGPSLRTSGTTDGTQTITVSWTPVPGQVSTRRFRGPSVNNTPSDTIPGLGIGGTSFIDAGNIFYTNGILNLGGTSSSLSSIGVTTPTLTLTNGGFKDTQTGTFTSNRTTTWPDLSGTVAKLSAFTLNGIPYGNGTNFSITAAGGAGAQCLVETAGGTPSFSACAGAAATAWSSLSNPTLDLSLNMGANNTLFTSGVLTGTRNVWEFVDGNSTSTGSLFNLHTGATSTLKPFTLTAQGVANGIQMNTSGVLAPLGTGGITASAWTPSLTANQLLVGNAGSISSLAGTLGGTNPVMTFTSSSISNVPLAINTPASPTADLFDLNINSVKTAWFDNLAIIHTPSATFVGSGALTLSGTEGTCPTGAAGIDILCIGNSTTHTIQSNLNGAGYKDIAQFSNSGPAAHGVCLVGAIFPQLNCTTAGTLGQPFVSQGAGADGLFAVLGVIGGGTGNATNTLHGIGMGEGTAPINFSTAGTAGQAFASGGAGADGAYGALNLAGGSSIFTGLLPISNGGTGAATLAAANIATVTGAITPNNCVKWSSATVVTDSGGTCGGVGGSARLDQLLGGTASNTINSTIFPQFWQWALTGSTTAFKFGENTAATGSSNILLQASTLNTSTAIPFQADNNGNGWQLSSTGLFKQVGTGALAIPGTTHGIVLSEGASGALATASPGTAGQVFISNGAGADGSFQDPIISQAFMNVWTAQDITTTRTSAAVRNPIFSQSGTLQLTWASITGSPATCTFQVQGVDSQGNVLNNGSTFAVSPANGTTSQTFTAVASLLTASQLKVIFACVTYPTTGTLTLDFIPIPNVNVTNTVQVAGTITTTPPSNASTNITQLAGTTTDTNSGNKSAGTLRVILATDQPQLTNKLLVTPDANVKVNVVGNAGVSLDAATGAAPPANAIFIGGLKSGATGGFVTGITACDLDFAVNIVTSTTTLVVTGVSGRQVRICSLFLFAAGADNVNLIEGTGATCGTGTAGLTGGTTSGTGPNLSANGGWTQGSGLGEIITTTTAGDSVCIQTSAAVQLSGHIKYTIY